ncbi:MAG: MBL fold metallo-hydrolase [Actinomycetota bacterium]|nr:MBL fold metallo-hydrolase [Actinomycetota bacterium]
MTRPEVIEGYATGAWSSNTYIVASRKGETAVIVDAGQDAAPLLAERLEANGLKAEALLVTHGHIDHVWSVAEVCAQQGIHAYMHPDDTWLIEDPAAALGAGGRSFPFDAPEDLKPLADGQRLRFAGLDIEVFHTPGHTPGSVVFITNGIVFSGDLIFQGSIGRTDFPRGSLEDLMDSIRRVILPLDDEVTILSGHGAETSVGAERRTNPFVVADARGELPRLLGL